MIELIGVILGAVASIVGGWLVYKNNKDSDVKKKIKQEEARLLEQDIQELEKQLITAMEKNITDVPGIRIRLEALRKKMKKLVVGGVSVSLLLFSGCFTSDPVIVGERVFYVKPDESIIVPALKPPAKQWYLIDDVAMLKVLGVDKPIEHVPSGRTVKGH